MKKKKLKKLNYHYFRDSQAGTRRRGLAGGDSQAGTNTISKPAKNNQLELFSKS